jgi:hypothetical protein
MASISLPTWHPDWVGAEEAVERLNPAGLRLRAQELVELVFGHGDRYLDALPEDIGSSIVTPLAMLSQALDHGTDVEVLVAARLVRRSVESLLAEAPIMLRSLVREMPVPAPTAQ